MSCARGRVGGKHTRQTQCVLQGHEARPAPPPPGHSCLPNWTLPPPACPRGRDDALADASLVSWRLPVPSVQSSVGRAHLAVHSAHGPAPPRSGITCGRSATLLGELAPCFCCPAVAEASGTRAGMDVGGRVPSLRGQSSSSLALQPSQVPLQLVIHRGSPGHGLSRPLVPRRAW